MIGTGSPEKRYELVERVAVGGMAEVFRAKAYGPHGFEKVLAIKRILPALAADPKFERRFIAEAKLAVSLSHANIVQVLDFSRFGQSLYIVMEYVDGGDLARVLETLRERQQLIPLPAAVHIAVELLKGLDFAHRRGVVHRDVSPSNILLSRAGEVKIADFGIAQAIGFEASRTLRIMGKWRYMSPEQSRGEELDPRSDVFSAAVVLHEVLTGQRLFPGSDAQQIAHNLRNMPLPRPSEVRPDLPPEIDEPLAAALVRDRDSRQTTAAQLLAALVEICYARSLPAMPTSLARFLDQVAAPAGAWQPPADASDSVPPSGTGLLDEIICSELEAQPAGQQKKREAGAGRRTAMALGPPAVAPEDLPSDQAADMVVPQAELTVAGAAFIRSVPDPTGVRRWELGDAPLRPVDEDDEDDDVTRAVESEVPDTPVPVLRSEELTPVPDPADQDSAVEETTSIPLPIPDDTSARSPVALASARPPAGYPMSRSATPPPSPFPPPLPIAAPLTPSFPPRLLSSIEASHSLGPAGPPVVSRRWIAVALALLAAAVLLAVMIAKRAGSDAPRKRASDIRPTTSDTTVEPAVATRPEPAPAPAPAPEPTPPTSGGEQPAAPPVEPESAPTPVDPPRDRGRTTERRRERFGTIDIYSEPWANIYLGKRKVGVAPQRRVKLPVGRHRLRLVNPVLERSAWVTVTVPSTRPVRVELPDR